MYKEEDYLQLSGIQHFAFCRRQWALAYIELQWDENVRTVEGKLLHEKAHDPTNAEKRGDLIISTLMSSPRQKNIYFFLSPRSSFLDRNFAASRFCSAAKNA